MEADAGVTLMSGGKVPTADPLNMKDFDEIRLGIDTQIQLPEY